MESPLNTAHVYQRNAEAYVQARRFEDALSSYKKAADLLLEAMQLTEVDKVLDSLKLQYEYHLRQQQVVRHKQKVFEILKKVVEKRLAAMAHYW